MSAQYAGYNQGGYDQGGYGQGGYGQPNPYDQRNGYGAQQGGYGNPSQGGAYQNDVEMQNMNGQGLGGDPNAILNECQEINRAINDLERRLQELEAMQRRFTTSNDLNSGQINALGADIMHSYRALGQRVTKLKSRPESGNPRYAPQVGNVNKKLQNAIQKYQTVESEFRRRVREQQERQYRIVRPEATEEEVRQACEDPNQQIFQQALMNSDRRGQSQSALGAVRARHDAIQNIEKTMVELSQMFMDLDAIVVQQEPMVETIEQKGEEVHENVTKGTVAVGKAVDSGRARNKKKWWCLGIFLIILIILAIVVAVVIVPQVRKNDGA